MTPWRQRLYAVKPSALCARVGVRRLPYSRMSAVIRACHGRSTHVTAVAVRRQKARNVRNKILKYPLQNPETLVAKP